MQPIKTISVSYCGGCNEACPRSEFVRELLAETAKIPDGPKVIHKDDEADAALLICGCHALCIAERPDCGLHRYKHHVIGPNILDYLAMPMDEVKAKLLDEFRNIVEIK